MLLLKAILVVLSTAIEYKSASSAKETEDTTLPPGALINSRDSDNCRSQHLPYFNEETSALIGFLAVSCNKPCRKGKSKPEVDGIKCIATWSSLGSSTITVLVGSCNKGRCNPGDPSECRNITLVGGDTQEEEEKIEDEYYEEDYIDDEYDEEEEIEDEYE
ncbi:uncharacterized protein LOC115322701, partial [Ixodes scapularis]|uniref:uncharacterized protein LOC115322701 n=1 Tax=Ixodes scapularis TaxID=6945 RepID=UPI001A9F02F7